MIVTTSDYRVTENFIGLIWKGRSIIGVDIAEWAWGVVLIKWYAGWYKGD